MLPQHEKSAYTYLLRRHEIEQRRLQYKWNNPVNKINGTSNISSTGSSSSTPEVSDDGDSEDGLKPHILLPGRMKVRGYDNLPKEAKFNVQVSKAVV